MAILPLPVRTTLLAETLSDPRVERVTAPQKLGPPEPVAAKDLCDCAPTSQTDAAREEKLAAYLKGRFVAITPLGPPPGDRRILAEAGIDLARFAAYPPGITPLPRSAAITALGTARSPREPEVLRALWNRLSLARAMPKGITSLTKYFDSRHGTTPGRQESVPPSAWAAYADAVGATAMGSIFPSPVVRVDEDRDARRAACHCEDPPTHDAKGR